MIDHKIVAVISRAAQGIGRCTAELLAEQGYLLALIDLKPLAGITGIKATWCSGP
jgi:NADP-dependent 3-hydroxy acid dehydrogenase YdfG